MGNVLIKSILSVIMIVSSYTALPDSNLINDGVDSIIIETEIEQYLSKMTTEDKIAQMFILRPETLSGEKLTAGESMQAGINDHPVGGFILFGDNLSGEEQTRAMISDIQNYSHDRIGLPMFICVDEEGGSVLRISGSGKFDVPGIPSMASIGAAGDTDQAYNAGSEIGEYLSDLGFNVDFAPVADVLTNPDNVDVRYRSFGSDPNLVADMVCSFQDGLESCGVYSTLKHFVGNGDTTADTHKGYAYSLKTKEDLFQCDLIPYIKSIEEGRADFIMVGHTTLPNISGEQVPNSVSYPVMSELLRDELGYGGITLTDSFEMGAVVQQYSNAHAAVTSVKAGADIILMPADFAEAYDGLLDAVYSNEITMDRIDNSIRRILKVKLDMMKNQK